MAMTQEEVQSAIRSMERDVDSLRDKATLADLQRETGNLAQDIDQFAVRLKEIRDCGYVFEEGLDAQIEEMDQSWKRMSSAVKAEIRRRSTALEGNFATIDSSFRRVKSMSNRPAAVSSQIERLKTRVDDFEEEVETAVKAIQSRYEPLENDINGLKSHLHELEWMYEELNQSSINLMETESLITAAEVRWYHDGKEDKKDPKGILYVSDQRLILETIEKKVKKKVLFVATESEIIREVAFECPVAYIEKTENFQQGMLKGQDHLRLFFTSQGPYEKTQFHLLNRDNQEFSQIIRRIQAGDYLKNRTEEIEEEVIERVKNAPSQCPGCGGAISQKILRGQDSITCEYCGTVIRL